MPPTVRYHILIQEMKKPEKLRKQMVEWYFAHQENASETARAFRTKRQRVTQWVERFRAEGVAGLKDRSRAPHTHPNQLSQAEERAILRLKARRRFAGPNRLKIEGIPHSTSTIYRVLKDADLVVKHKKRYQRRRMLSEVKRQAKALQYWQVDVKYLDDIGGLWPFIEAGTLPGFAYTARDVRTGTTFVCYAYEINEVATGRFVRLLLEHLKRFGIELRDVIIQTDNGSENIGNIYAKKDSLVSELIEETFHATHRTIPIRSPRFQSHVESFHGIVEREFYAQEYLPTEHALLAKATTYLWWFNLERKNLTTKKTPFALVKEQTAILDPRFLNFPPILLDALPWFATALKTVPYVTDEVMGCDGLAFLPRKHHERVAEVEIPGKVAVEFFEFLPRLCSFGEPQMQRPIGTIEVDTLGFLLEDFVAGFLKHLFHRLDRVVDIMIVRMLLEPLFGI